MHIKNKIIKASWNHFEDTKNTLITNMSLAIKNGNLKIDENVLPQLLSFLNSSFEEGYHKGFNSFERELSSYLTEAPRKNPLSSKKN